MNNKIVVIVVTFNRKELLKKVLNSLFNQSLKIDRIIVVDNNSNDGTEEMVCSLNSDQIQYHNTGRNLGGSGGFYEGFALAEQHDFDYLWLMDDDFLPNTDCLERMLDKQPTGIVQPVRYNLDGSCAELSPITYDLQKTFSLSPKGKTVKSYIEEQNSLPELITIEAIPFEGPLIPKEVVNIVGKPEPRFFIFCDDIDYAIRAKNAGVTIVCDMGAKATRLLVNNQNNDMLSWKGFFMLRNLFHLHKKHGKNFIIRNKPIVLAIGYGMLCFLKGEWKQIGVVWNAFLDSTKLENTESHKPRPKIKS
ncbi:TPA: glycosyltransferase family 2 protein [Citrobacter amalonaticus]|nr:glycosyltransferase family 2 protein [Citrobacter amalonaticus]